MLRLTTVVACLPAATAPAGAAPKAGQDALDQGLNAVTAAGVPAAFAEVRTGDQVWRGGAGVAELGSDRPARPWFAHRVGSITKTFTAATVLQLVGEGRIELDAPIGRYLRGLPLGSAGSTVTVRMLLNQTSGIADYDTISPGLIIEHVTGRTAAAETSRRIIKPLGLRDTYFPGTDLRIRGPHARG